MKMTQLPPISWLKLAEGAYVGLVLLGTVNSVLGVWWA
jgi:hypothetical protein